MAKERLLTATGGKKRKAIAASGKRFKKGGRKSASKDKVKRRKTGPRLPNAIRKELGLVDSNPQCSDEETGSERDSAAQDFYEREEGIPQESSMKNRLLDEVEKREYELPEDFENIDEHNENQTAKPTHEVAIFASGSWRKMKRGIGKDADSCKKPFLVADDPALQKQDLKIANNEESDKEMVDGFLSSEMKDEYVLLHQDCFIHVELEFEKDKMKISNEENNEPEKPVLLPGLGQWINVQQKKGLPASMVKEHEYVKQQKRQESLKKRKGAHLKEADNLLTKTLPLSLSPTKAARTIGAELCPALPGRGLCVP